MPGNVNMTEEHGLSSLGVRGGLKVTGTMMFTGWLELPGKTIELCERICTGLSAGEVLYEGSILQCGM